MAGRRQAAGLILDAPFTYAVEFGASAYPYLPVRLLLRDRYESARHLSKVSVPLLILHGENDRVVPVEMGRKMAAIAPGPVELVVFPSAGHTDLFEHGAEDVVGAWLSTLRALSKPTRSGSLVRNTNGPAEESSAGPWFR